MFKRWRTRRAIERKLHRTLELSARAEKALARTAALLTEAEALFSRLARAV